MIKSYGFWGLEYADDNRNDMEYRKYKKEVELHYSRTLKKWVNRDEYFNDGDYWHIYPAWYPCSSLKAAKKHLKKHNEIPKGTKFRLVSSYVGFDIYLSKK